MSISIYLTLRSQFQVYNFHVDQVEEEPLSSIHLVPGEILLKILKYLGPRDLLAAGAACRYTMLSFNNSLECNVHT